jgi:hypothetical protein
MVVEQVQLKEVLVNHALVGTMVVDTVLVVEVEEEEEEEHFRPHLAYCSWAVVPSRELVLLEKEVLPKLVDERRKEPLLLGLHLYLGRWP